MRILLRLTGLAWHYRVRLLLAYVSLLGSIAFTLAIPRFLGTAIDHVLASESRSELVLLALAILVASLLRGLFDFGRVYFGDSTSQKVAYELRNALYDQLQHLSFAYHDKEHTGNLMSTATADVEGIRRYINMGMIRGPQIIVMIVVIAVLMFQLNWSLALMSLTFVPILVVRASAVFRKLRRMWRRVQDLVGEMVTVLQENLAGIHVVKAFAAEEYEKDKFERKTRELAEESYRSDKLEGANSAVMTLFFTLATGLILWYGGRQVISGNLTPGGLAQFLFYMGLLAFPIRMTAQLTNIFAGAISSGERIFLVLDAESPVKEKPNATEMGRVRGYVRFEDVSFSYDSLVPALRHVNITAWPGQVIALLGAPGSGKSTIANLIPRFYDVTGGRVTIDGVDIRDLTLESLRRNVGIVQQEVFLFNATIKENIAYGVVDASFEDIVRAAQIAQLHDFIESLPNGYDTWVGERGVTLSGGQRQRLAIARTILIDPPILILDDSTSSVDVETERYIRKAMEEVVKGRTNFVIAHRLSTVQNADLILVLKDGEIVEQGTHQELQHHSHIYKEIYELQLRPSEEILLDAHLSGNE